MSEPFDLRDTFAHLKATGAEPVPTGPDFWAELASSDRNYPGRLAMILPMTEDFPHWERHPAGEELIVMLSGACTLILETAAGETRTHLEAGKAVLVPTGIARRSSSRAKRCSSPRAKAASTSRSQFCITSERLCTPAESMAKGRGLVLPPQFLHK